MVSFADAMINTGGQVYGKIKQQEFEQGTLEKLFDNKLAGIDSEKKKLDERFALGKNLDAKTETVTGQKIPEQGKKYLRMELDELEKQFLLLKKAYDNGADPAQIEREFKKAESKWLSYVFQKEALFAYYKGAYALHLQTKAAIVELDKYWEAYSKSMNDRAKRVGAYIWEQGAEKEQVQMPNPEYEAIMAQLGTARKEFDKKKKTLETSLVVLSNALSENPANLLKVKEITDKTEVVLSEKYIKVYTDAKKILDACASFSFALILNSGDSKLIKLIVPDGDIRYETSPTNPLVEKTINPFKDFIVVLTEILKEERNSILDKTVGYTKSYVQADPENAKKISGRYNAMIALLEKAKTPDEVVNAMKDLEPIRKFASGAISKTMEWELAGTEKVTLMVVDFTAIALSVFAKNPIIANAWFTLKGGFMAGYGIKTNDMVLVKEGLILMAAFAVPSAGKAIMGYSKSLPVIRAGQGLALTGIGFQIYFATEMTAGIAKSAIDLGTYGTNPSDMIDLMSNAVFLGMMAKGLPQSVKGFGKSKMKEEFLEIMEEKDLRAGDNVIFGGKKMKISEVLDALNTIATNPIEYGSDSSKAAVKLLEMAQKAESDSVSYMAKLKLRKMSSEELPEETEKMLINIGGAETARIHLEAVPKSISKLNVRMEKVRYSHEEYARILQKLDEIKKEIITIENKKEYTLEFDKNTREEATEILDSIGRYKQELSNGITEKANKTLADIIVDLHQFSLSADNAAFYKMEQNRPKFNHTKSRPTRQRTTPIASIRWRYLELVELKKRAVFFERTAEQKEMLIKSLTEVAKLIKPVQKDGFTKETLDKSSRQKIPLNEPTRQLGEDILKDIEAYTKESVSGNNSEAETILIRLGKNLDKYYQGIQDQTIRSTTIVHRFSPLVTDIMFKITEVERMIDGNIPPG